MINPEKLQNSIYALHGAIIRARFLAYQPGNDQQVAGILSEIEVLMTMLGNDSDETVPFRRLLEKVAKDYQCNFVLERFDTSKPWETI